MSTRWKYFGDAHRWVYEKTDGRVGARLAGLHMLLLTTRGRRSGISRTLPLAAMPDGDDWVVVASNNGGPSDPAWYLNLSADPAVRVRAGRDVFEARAEVADAATRARLWPRLVAYNPPFGTYEKRTSREIPVILLRRP